MGERLVSSDTELVKFSNPYSVQTKDDLAKPSTSKASQRVEQQPGGSSSISNIQEILNCILAPREWKDQGIIWRQEVSPEPATRKDVIKLTDELDARLQEREARETGLCPIRNQLYASVFNEVIRQITVNCAERGILLLRIRDELHMTIHAYRTLYESSVAYGMRKTLGSMEEKHNKQQEIEDLKKTILGLEDELKGQQQRFTMMERRAEELREAEERKSAEELNFLKKTNAQLKAQLEAIIAPKK